MELLRELDQLRVKVTVIDGEHIAIAPKDRLTQELIEKLKANKQELIASLNRREKEAQMNSYLNQAILRLNRLYASGGFIRWSSQGRDYIRRIEREITESFLLGKVEACRRNVEKWETYFKGALSGEEEL